MSREFEDSIPRWKMINSVFSKSQPALHSNHLINSSCRFDPTKIVGFSTQNMIIHKKYTENSTQNSPRMYQPLKFLSRQKGQLKIKVKNKDYFCDQKKLHRIDTLDSDNFSKISQISKNNYDNLQYQDQVVQEYYNIDHKTQGNFTDTKITQKVHESSQNNHDILLRKVLDLFDKADKQLLDQRNKVLRIMNQKLKKLETTRDRALGEFAKKQNSITNQHNILAISKYIVKKQRQRQRQIVQQQTKNTTNQIPSDQTPSKISYNKIQSAIKRIKTELNKSQFQNKNPFSSIQSDPIIIQTIQKPPHIQPSISKVSKVWSPPPRNRTLMSYKDRKLQKRVNQLSNSSNIHEDDSQISKNNENNKLSTSSSFCKMRYVQKLNDFRTNL